MVTDDRSIDLASSVVLDSSGDLVITEGEPSLVIHAPAAVIESLTATVEDGVLELGVRRGVPEFLLGDVRYELTLPSLEGLEINGSGDVTSDIPGASLEVEISGSGDIDIESIDAASVTLEINGSGDVELSGRTDGLSVSIDGSGEVRADELDSANAEVSIDGAGDVTVAASELLDISISGSGSVTYSGRPEVTQDISGSGEVSQS